MKEKIKYVALLIACKTVAIWPYWVLHLFSHLLYPVMYYVVKYRREVTRDNLLNAFPEKTKEEIIGIEKAFYLHFCDYLLETIKLMQDRKSVV